MLIPVSAARAIRSLALGGAAAALLLSACLKADPTPPRTDGPSPDMGMGGAGGSGGGGSGGGTGGTGGSGGGGSGGGTGGAGGTGGSGGGGAGGGGTGGTAGMDGGSGGTGGGGDDGGPAPDLAPDLRPDVTVTGPLYGHWPLDEGMGMAVADASGNGNGGTLMNGATWTTMGFMGAMFPNPAALVLDGVDDFVELGVRAIPATDSPKTVSLWFWLEAPVAGIRKNLLALTNLEAGAGVQVGLDAGRATVWLMADPLPLIATAAPVAAGWHHVVYTYDGTTHQLFVDNQMIGTSPRAPKPGEVVKARLGAYDLMDEMFGGRIDDVRIYTRALDAAAVATLFGGGTP
jgi:hypothetical protein